MSERTAVIIPAAGSGQRMGGVAKAFLQLAGEPMLMRTLRPFLADVRVERVVIALDPATHAGPPSWLIGLDPRIRLVAGGQTRGESVSAALQVAGDVDVILIHDAARPLVTAMVIDRAIRAAADGECVIAATPVTDTIQQVNGHGAIVATPDRRTLWRAQTPQAFPRSIVAAAYRQAEADGFLATDDAAIITRYGGTVRVIEGDPGNMKITVPADVRIAEALLGK